MLVGGVFEEVPPGLVERVGKGRKKNMREFQPTNAKPKKMRDL